MKKIPDLVVWNQEQGYYASKLPYGSNLSATSIKMENVEGWKISKINEINKNFKQQYEELIQTAEKLKREFEINELLYTKVNFNFQPIQGQVYHLYSKNDESLFLSIIEPSSWNMKYMGSYKLDSSNKWIEVIH